MQVNKSTGLKTLFNMLNRKIQAAIKDIKQTILCNKFNQLKYLNQSESNHWKLIKKLEDELNEIRIMIARAYQKHVR